MLLMVGMFALSIAHTQAQQFQQGVLRKPKEESGKLDRLYKVSEWTLGVGTTLDGLSTARALDHPTVALRTDGTVLARFYSVEEGWAGPVVGRRNTNAVVLANVLLNVGVRQLSRNLYRRGGKWRLLAIGLNVWKATDSTTAAVGNFRFCAGINDRLRVTTGYQGKIIWSH